MVFQNYALYPHMSVAGNIGFSLKMAGVSRAEVDRRVREAADTLKIAHLLERKPAELSGGQRQRVAIGRAIVRDPNVFLFDEPLSNLDAELRVTMRVELGAPAPPPRATMLYVTHDQVEAMTLADRIVVMREGRIEQIGAPHQLYTDPDNVFVAGFIGSPRIELPGGERGKRNAAPSRRNGDRDPFGAVRRPLHDRVAAQHLSIGGGGGHTLPVTVDMIEYLGGTRYVYGRLSDDTPSRSRRARTRPSSPATGSGHVRRCAPHALRPDGRRIRSGLSVSN